MNKRSVVAGNWKMNLNSLEANDLVQDLLSLKHHSARVILGVPYVYISSLARLTNGTNIEIAAQNCHHKEKGAYTGEISVNMLKSIGTDYVILGHSERREYFGEDEALILEKMQMAHQAGLKVIYCCGEPLSVREAGEQNDYVEQQLRNSLLKLDKEQMQNTIIAYEPIWAIGTGKTASADQAQDMHKHIRQLVNNQFSAEMAEETSILYGGSVKPANANELFAKADVDGGLVGGASLKAELFGPIIEAIIE